MSRTWGPFTGRQLTTIICVIVLTIAFPFGASAVTGSSAFITDATTGNHATVYNGALTTNVAPTHNFVLTAITGVVEGDFTAVLSASSSHADIVTQIDLSWHGMTVGTDYLYITLGKVNPNAVGDGPCGSLSNKPVETMYFPNAQDLRQFMFNPGYVVPGGTSLCIGFSGAGALTARAYGYFTASTAVASPFLGRMVDRRAVVFGSFLAR
jgi:hypothetical protein